MTEPSRTPLARELILPLILFVATTFYLVEALTNGSMFRYGLPSAGFMPVILSVAMYAALLSVVIGLLRSRRRAPEQFPDAAPDDGLPIPDDQDRPDGSNMAATLAVMAVCLLYVLAFRPLGFVLSTILFTLGLLAAFRFGWGRGVVGVALNLVVALAVCAMVYVFFSGLFGIQLPRFGG